jgi:excisionase family DNA binding protein
MEKQILIIESISAKDFKEEILKDIHELLKIYLTTPKHADENELLTIKETGQMLSIGKVTLWKLTKEGIIPSYKIGARVFYKKSEIINSLQQKESNPNKQK